jgi:hypothetical protein
MRQDVSVVFGAGDEVSVALAAGESGWSPEDGRRWLDEQFVANDCEPLRASGKVLTVDKLLAIAVTVGRRRFDEDESFRLGFARAALAALARPVVRIDVEAGTVSY